MRLWRWSRVLSVSAVIVLILCYLTISNLINPCLLKHSLCGAGDIAGSLGEEPPSEPHPNSLADLNGIEICLSTKFVEPLQNLELTGSPQLGDASPYAVVYNYLKSSRFYGINETVTYTTHSTPEFMDNIGTVADRWDGPVSVAVYVPSTDFCRAVHHMIYLRNCDKAAYRERVTWHLFWRKDSPPPSNWRLVPDESRVDCDKLAADFRENEDLKKTWRSIMQLPYPVNVARNIARQASTTWFLLPSDVELYPSKSLAPQFMEFIKSSANIPVKQTTSVLSQEEPKILTSGGTLRVYVVPVFEVEHSIPDTKEELMVQYARHDAVYFHKLICAHCQKFPGLNEWLHKAGTPGKIKAQIWSYRHRPFHRWEPIFICTNREPLYEERLTWEGLQDKMTQMHELCLREYQFHVLDRAFLVHSPGIKRNKNGVPTFLAWRETYIKENSRLYDQIIKDLEDQLGSNERCLSRL